MTELDKCLTYIYPPCAYFSKNTLVYFYNMLVHKKYFTSIKNIIIYLKKNENISMKGYECSLVKKAAQLLSNGE